MEFYHQSESKSVCLWTKVTHCRSFLRTVVVSWHLNITIVAVAKIRQFKSCFYLKTIFLSCPITILSTTFNSNPFTALFCNLGCYAYRERNRLNAFMIHDFMNWFKLKKSKENTLTGLARQTLVLFLLFISLVCDLAHSNIKVSSIPYIKWVLHYCLNVERRFTTGCKPSLG